MRVLVAYASRHGSTAGIAERIAARLREKGLEADALDVEEAGDVLQYEAFVVGSAAYMFHWMKEATSFVKRHISLLTKRPLWLFSSGPLGTDMVDDEGNDILEASRPKEFEEMESTLDPMDTRVFSGAWDPDAPPKSMAERFMKIMPVSRDALPVGDFRDWDEIDSWADEIAAALSELRPIGRA
jgi:menaquinone-dependent protoporphyrinogen oxidase